jgi:hypothetical protein
MYSLDVRSPAVVVEHTPREHVITVGIKTEINIGPHLTL